LVELNMDIVELIRDEWPSLGLIPTAVLGVYVAAVAGEWHWVAISLALAVSSLRILQLKGWIPSTG